MNGTLVTCPLELVTVTRSGEIGVQYMYVA